MKTVKNAAYGAGVQPGAVSCRSILICARSQHTDPDGTVDAEEVVCQVCKRDVDDASLLLCDSCDGAFHTYCLTPPLLDVPEGDWFCDACIAEKRDRTRRRQRRLEGLVASRGGSLWSVPSHNEDDKRCRERFPAKRPRDDRLDGEFARAENVVSPDTL